MIQTQSAPQLLVICTLVVVLVSVGVLVAGRKLTRQGDWAVGTALAILLGGTAVCWRLLLDDEWKAVSWLRGWLWPPDTAGALNVGILPDALGLSMSLLVILFAAVLLSSQALVDRREHPRPERLFGAIGLSAAGVALAWTSLTPWLAFIGLGLASVAGFFALVPRWDSDEEAALAIRFGCERACGLILAVVGACGLAGPRTTLLWGGASPDSAPVWSPLAGAVGEDGVSAALLVIGLLIQFQPFPFLGMSLRAPKGAPWLRITLAQILPAWSAFAFLFRLEPHLRSIPVFGALGWVMLGFAALNLISGILQDNWKTGIALFVSAGMTLAAASLFLAGPYPGLSLLIAVGLGCGAFAGAASLPQGNPWLRAACLLGMAAATGVAGFVSAGGIVRWIWQEWSEQPGLASFSILIFFLFVTLGWKVFWDLLSETKGEKVSSAVHWSSIVGPFVLLLPSMGWLWSGSLSGGIIPGSADRVLPSLFDRLFVSPALPDWENTALLSSVGFYLGALLLGVGAAYWLSGKVRAAYESEHDDRFGSKLFRFVAGGYGVDTGGRRFLAGLTWIGAGAQRAIDGVLWQKRIPEGLSVAIDRVGQWTSRADEILSDQTSAGMARVTDLPVRLLQLIQNGDVQWYLVFAVVSGFAILIHFLRT